MPVSTGTPGPGQSGTTPNLPGWHLVTFQNGDVAVVRWNGSSYVWGSLHPPASPITGTTWLGSSIASINWTNWNSAVGSLPAHVAAALISLIDAGALSKGQPVLVNNQGRATGGSDPWIGSEAVPTNLIPSPINPNVGNSNLSLSLSNTLGSIFNQAVSDLKYGALLLVALVAGAYLIVHGLTGKTNPRDQGSRILEVVKR